MTLNERDFGGLSGDSNENLLKRRRQALAALARFSVADLCEMAIVINLLGVESATSVLAANHLGMSTGGIDIKPRVDLGIRTNRTLQQGYPLTAQPDHSIAGVIPEILPAKKMASDNPIPYYMAAGNKLKQTVEEGKLLTYGMIDHDPQSCLWSLRREQDKFV